MELLIPGLILVALMIYASTRIKRSAARAFEAESIETDDFRLQKPEGFLNVIGGDPKYVFEAYSKDFGGDGAENIRLATADVVIKANTTVEAAHAEILNSGGEILDDHREKIGDAHYRTIVRKLAKDDMDFRILSKVAERGGKVFVFTTTVIAETTPDFMRNIEAMVNSFELKYNYDESTL